MSPPRPTFAAAALTLWQRDLVRFFRQRNRVVGALATPILFWLVLGSGLGSSFTLPDGHRAQGMEYLEYFFPGALLMILLFTAIFSTFSIIEDRREGFLQGVLVSPASRAAIVAGKVLGGASIAVIQGVIFLLAWPLVGSWPGVAFMVGAAGVMTLLALALVALGLCIAWPMDSTTGFHAIMNLFLMPLWLLSGAAFPVGGASPWVRAVMWCNPLTYGHAALTSLLHGDTHGIGAPVPVLPATAVTAAAAVGLWLAAVAVATRSRREPIA